MESTIIVAIITVAGTIDVLCYILGSTMKVVAVSGISIFLIMVIV